MTSSFLKFLFLFSCFLYLADIFHAQSCHFPNSLVFPITKDLSTHQYVTQIYLGTPLVPIKLVVDLGGPFLWFDCASRHVSSSSGHLISSCSTQCSKAKAHDLESKSCCFPGKSRTTCDLQPQNGITKLTTRGELVGDIIAVGSLDVSEVGQISTVQNFLFTCAHTFLLQGLASGTNGMLGLGRAQISLPSQLATRKFTICPSSSNGVVSLGDGPTDSIFGTDVSRSLTYTPLITNLGSSTSQDYFINVRSIKINGERLSLNKSLLLVDQNGKGGTKLSTIVPYTTMESSIYVTFIKAYMKVANSMNMTRVAPVAPFGLCFSTPSVEPVVPNIDLVLQSEMVKWRVHGRNSMVHVGDEVMCLGILDGGFNPLTSIVIGGFQLEDNLLEFDLGTSMLGFGSLMSMRQTSCSDFISNSRLKQSF